MRISKIFVCLISFLMFSPTFVPTHGYEYRFSPIQRYIKYHGTITLDITATALYPLRSTGPETGWLVGLDYKVVRHCFTTINFDINFDKSSADLIFGPDSDFLVGHSQSIPIYFTEEWTLTPDPADAQKIRLISPDHGRYQGKAEALIWGIYKKGINDIVAINLFVSPEKNAELYIGQSKLEWRQKSPITGKIYTFHYNHNITSSVSDMMNVALDLSGYLKITKELSKAGFSPSDVGSNLEAARKFFSASFNYTALKTYFSLKRFSGEIEFTDYYKIMYSGSLNMKTISEGFFLWTGGESWVKPQGTSNYTRISEYRENVKPGDEVKTSDSGRAGIALSDGSKIILSPNTVITLESDKENPETWNALNLTEGKIEVYLEPLIGQELDIQTPNAIISLNSTGLNIQIVVEFDENTMTTVTVLTGEAKVQEAISKNNVSLEQNQKITIPTLQGGLDQQSMFEKVLWIDPSSVERWWEQSFISCSVSPETIIIGNSIKISGSLDPSLTAENVTLTYTKPDGSSFNRTVQTVSGSFYDFYKPKISGQWRITASWPGTQDFKATISKPAILMVEPKPFLETSLGRATMLGVIIAIAVVMAILKRRKS